MADDSLPRREHRDATVRINSYTALSCRADVSLESFHDYWANVHGPLCSRIPGLGFYVQNHFARASHAHGWPMPEGATAHADYHPDGAVEIGWSDTSQQQVFEAASPLLFSDEKNFIGWDVGYALPEGSTTVVDRIVDPSPNADGLDRLHVHFTPRAGRADDLVDHLLALLSRLADDGDLLLKARLHAPQPYDNDTPNPPAPDVSHDVPPARTTIIAVELAFASPLDRRRVFASEVFTAATATQADLVEQVTTLTVTEAITFVRDGRPTTAGLRGARTARIIERLGALNQVMPDVERLFVPSSDFSE